MPVGGSVAHSTLLRFEFLRSVRIDPIVIPPVGSSPPMQICVTSPEVGCVVEKVDLHRVGAEQPVHGLLLVDLEDAIDAPPA